MSEMINRDTNQPHLLRLVDEELPTQYFVAVEQVIHMEVSCIEKGIFLLLALHYVYDMHYHPRLNGFFYFFEDKVLSFECSFKLQDFPNLFQCYYCFGGLLPRNNLN